MDKVINYYYYVFFFFQDVFYLTQDELYAFVDGRSVTNNLMGLVELRKKEYGDYRKVSQPKRLLVKWIMHGSILRSIL